MKAKKLIAVAFLILLGTLIGLYVSNWIKYKEAISLLRKGQAEYIVDGHSVIKFKFIDGKEISVKNLLFAPFGDLSEEIRKCGEPCKNTGFWIE